jgi:hypothetical protein
LAQRYRDVRVSEVALPTSATVAGRPTRSTCGTARRHHRPPDKKVGSGAVLSGNAKVVVFDAFRHNVVTPDTNGLRDMFALVR